MLICPQPFQIVQTVKFQPIFPPLNITVKLQQSFYDNMDIECVHRRTSVRTCVVCSCFDAT